ncbi:hypothetical protein DPEC_G00211710 [Dallia pectoralis]|uniref:Uncharacterized protein n=1 Tax=Dallia pectoralis TaxID=75939 RepID=A0ACC2G684_DALPE|nr:hypothetical protein DPEC_G00211710 [Dallia pectoralis]
MRGEVAGRRGSNVAFGQSVLKSDSLVLGIAGAKGNKVSFIDSVSLPPNRATMIFLLILSMPVLLLAQPPLYQEPASFLEDYTDYSLENVESADVQHQPQLPVAQQLESELPGPFEPETEPTEPGPLDCREEQYICTRLYSVHKPCKQCLNSICFYSLRRVYVINREVCVSTVCAHEELLRADMCRDQFSRCGVAAVSGQCGALGSSCGKSCGRC